MDVIKAKKKNVWSYRLGESGDNWIVERNGRWSSAYRISDYTEAEVKAEVERKNAMEPQEPSIAVNYAGGGVSGGISIDQLEINGQPVKAIIVGDGEVEGSWKTSLPNDIIGLLTVDGTHKQESRGTIFNALNLWEAVNG